MADEEEGLTEEERLNVFRWPGRPFCLWLKFFTHIVEGNGVVDRFVERAENRWL